MYDITMQASLAASEEKPTLKAFVSNDENIQRKRTYKVFGIF